MKNPCTWFIGLSLSLFLAACELPNRSIRSTLLNSRFNDQQPALSGDGRWLAFSSNRNGSSQILLYDLQKKQFVNLPNLNRNSSVLQNPSLSRTGRYLVYLSSQQGKPEIIFYDRATKQADSLIPGYRSWIKNPRISPNGRYITFETARRGQWDIEVLDRGPNVELDLPDGSPVTNP